MIIKNKTILKKLKQTTNSKRFQMQIAKCYSCYCFLGYLLIKHQTIKMHKAPPYMTNKKKKKKKRSIKLSTHTTHPNRDRYSQLLALYLNLYSIVILSFLSYPLCSTIESTICWLFSKHPITTTTNYAKFYFAIVYFMFS